MRAVGSCEDRLLTRLREAIRYRKGGLRTRRRLSVCPTWSATCPTIAILLVCCPYASALDPSLDVSQYAHAAWTIREGFFKGNIYAMAQTPDGYLWLGTEFGLLRFDGVRSVPWQPPSGQHLPGTSITKLLASRDGTLWIGTDAGLVSWNGAKLIRYPELDTQLVLTLLEDRNGTVWAGGLGTPAGQLCAIRSGSAQCYGQDGTLGRMVLSLYEDNAGDLWAGAQSGLWRWTPGHPTHYEMPPTEINDLNQGEEGELLIAMTGGTRQLINGKSEPYPIRGVAKSVKANRLLRDRDGGLWIGTRDRGLIHLYHGRTDVFSRSDGLSGDLIFSLLEDREGNVWAATNGGLDRFREFPTSTITVRQGLSTDVVWSVAAASDGSIWVGTGDGLNKWSNGQITVIRNAGGQLDAPQSLFQDDVGRIWAFTGHGLAYIEAGRFVRVSGVPGGTVHFITGGKTGDLWLSENRGLLHWRGGHMVEQIPWSALGRLENASVLLADREQGGVWLGFWRGGGVSYFRDGQGRASYAAVNGLGTEAVADLRLDQDGALWVATEGGGLSRLKDGRIATLTSRNGLPCNTVHWTMEDDDHSFWLYTACGLVRIARSELDAWIADSKRTIQTTVWDAAAGVRLRSTSPSGYGPRVAKSTDGKLWFVTGEGVQVVDPRHLPFNKLPPPVHIQQITADHKTHAATSGLRLPPAVRDLAIDYTALSLVAPEKNLFRYQLEGYDGDWIDAGNRRQAFYNDLPPRNYRFRVVASNNSGVWNEAGDTLEFSIDPAYYQATWFRALTAAVILAMLWALYRYRLNQVAREFNARLEERVNERTRIARDLHDTLLQSFQGLMLRFQVGVDMLPPGKEKEALEKALERGDQAIVEGREAVHDLRSSTEITNDLAEAMKAVGLEMGQELAGNLAPEDSAAPNSVPHSAKFRVMVEGPSRNLHPILRDEIYRIAREAVRNAFRHAQAREIEAEITYSDRLLRVRIRDDGRGMDPGFAEEGRKGHYGLPGMRERAKRIGGQLNVWSGSGAGTEVELAIPASIAYGTSRARTFSGWFHKKTKVN